MDFGSLETKRTSFWNCFSKGSFSQKRRRLRFRGLSKKSHFETFCHKKSSQLVGTTQKWSNFAQIWHTFWAEPTKSGLRVVQKWAFLGQKRQKWPFLPFLWCCGPYFGQKWPCSTYRGFGVSDPLKQPSNGTTSLQKGPSFGPLRRPKVQ